jgi:hypothetical protein
MAFIPDFFCHHPKQPQSHPTSKQTRSLEPVSRQRVTCIPTLRCCLRQLRHRAIACRPATAPFHMPQQKLWTWWVKTIRNSGDELFRAGKPLLCECSCKGKEDSDFLPHESNKQTERSGNVPDTSADTRNLAALTVLMILVPRRYGGHSTRAKKEPKA